ncbi:MAG: hypothetical protein ACC655_03190 [Rhodothermia bacterium]
MIFLEDGILMHLQAGKRIPVDPNEIYLLVPGVKYLCVCGAHE